MDSQSNWNISNILSASRIILLVPILFFLFYGIEEWKIVLVILVSIATLTDFLDGYFARKFNQITELGKILDPIADKICVGALAFSLVLLGKIPLWFFLVVIVRDVLILFGGLYVKSKSNIVLQSNQLGKWTVGIVSLTIFLSLFENSFARIYLSTCVAISVAMLILSFVLYLSRFLKILKTT